MEIVSGQRLCDQIHCMGSCDCCPEMAVGSNVPRMSLAIMEPDINSTHMAEDTKANMVGIISKYMNTLARRSHYHLGYPANLEFDYAALAPLQVCFINNIGDPFVDGSHDMHSREFEVAVLDWFANLWEIEKNEYWGYVTVGGTEGNLHGILNGREILPDGILYTSGESHYSIFKAAKMYKMECIKVDTLFTGEIDYEALKAKLILNKDKPAIININIGTTFKGAVDNVDKILEILEECEFSQDRFYIHCDGALSGIMMPFLNNAPKISFKKPIGSVTISGHKFVGCPMPCGVYITRQCIHTLSTTVEYLRTRDTTIMGSRSGHTPILLWYTLNMKGYKGFHKQVQRCHKNAMYLKDRLVEEGVSVMLNALSTTVVFERPRDKAFVHRWQIASEGNMSHIILMPNVTVEKLDEFLEELVKKRSEWYEDGRVQIPCLAADIGDENCLCFLHK